MKTRSVIFATVLAAASTAALGAAPQGNAARGKSVFTSELCWTCHGTEGHGSVYGPQLAPHVFPWEAFAKQVRHPMSSMPAYAPRYLTDKDLADIYAYLSSIPEGAKASTIPILKE
jgi:mono/diheme cytochrome c family protein